MRLKKVTVSGLIPFPGVATLDVEALPRGVVAVRGENGEGKSTFFEAGVLGSAYRECPTRGSLIGVAKSREAFVETVWDLADGEHVIRQTMDPGSRDVESFVLGPDKLPCLASAKVTEFDAWAAKRLLPISVTLATLFVPQKRAGFLDLTVAERKALVLRVLGIEHLETLADRAGKALLAAVNEAAKLDAAIATTRRGAATVDDAAAELAKATTRRDDLAGVLAEAKEALATAAARAEALDEAFRNADAARKKRAPLLRRVESLAARDASEDKRIEDLGKVLAAAGTWSKDEAAAAVEKLAEELKTVELKMARLSVDIGACNREARDAAAVREREARREAAAIARASARTALLAELVEIGEAQAKRDALAAGVESAKAAVNAAAKAAADINAARHGEKDRRLDGLRAGLKDVVTFGRPPHSYAGVDLASGAEERLKEDDAAILAAKLAPEREKEAAEAVLLATLHRDRQEAGLRELDAKIRGLGAVEERLRSAEAAAKDAEDAAAVGHEAKNKEAAALAKAKSFEALASECRLVQERLKADAERARTERSRAESLERTTALLAELGAQAKVRAKEREVAAADLALAPEPPADAPPPPDLSRERALVEGHERALATAERDVGSATANLERAREVAAALILDEARLAGLRETAADLTLIRDGLGRNGIQALEIDAAGPELSALANGFLHECYGTRWTVTLVTTRPKDGGGEAEVFDVRVLDTRPDRDREDPIKTKSGGEGTILGEAITLALATFAARRAGLPEGLTFIRDESGAALDGPKARAYVDMLRKAAALCGAARVLVVTHSADVIAAADGRVCVHRGAVAVCSGPCSHASEA